MSHTHSMQGPCVVRARLDAGEQPLEKGEVEILRPAFSYFQEAVSSVHHRFFLSGPIVEPEYYAGLLQAMYSGSEADPISIHLNTPGGVAATGVQIINAMLSSQALITAVLDGEACSMGALIFLAAPNKIAMPDTTLMFHTYSGGGYGVKSSDQLAQVLYGVKWYRRMLERHCSPFLSSDEIEAIMGGKDLYIPYEEIEERLARKVAPSTSHAAAEAEARLGRAPGRKRRAGQRRPA